MRLEIQCEDRIGMIREILDLFVPHKIDIRLIEVDTKQRCIYCGFSDIPFSQLQTLLAEIRRLDSVEDVKTVMFTPFEREHHSLHLLLESLPDGVISVDLKGRITMMTEQAAEDLNVTVVDCLYQPLSQVLKGVSLSKDLLGKQQSISKRIRIRNKTFLLEMKPIFVSDEEGTENLAGSVIYLKSELRLDKQAARLKQAPNAENPLEAYFQPSVVKSFAMQETLAKAEAFSSGNEPLFVMGEMGSGKRHFVEALFQYWQKHQADPDAQLIIRPANSLNQEDISALESVSGWLVLEDIEHLDDAAQAALMAWLNRQQGAGISFDKRLRVISLSSLSEQELLGSKALNKALYFSLATLVLTMPPLRERKEDIEGLVQQLVLALAERHKVTVPNISKEVMTKLALYDWPGNLKELQNRCLQTFLTVKGKNWQAEDVALPEMDLMSNLSLINNSLDQTVKHWEAELLRRLYPEFPSSRRLAKAVGMSHSTIANKLKEYGIGTK
ncbi:TyrR/PhhR family helix-turn-helix DNA-binding protein [Marinomonas sp. 2405UD66-6]|uniref:TyrR/PhhR family helix-turn-helix DNA-binding protein n=1 Tax=Marinomonas sp. 2405UD66-6 TaxID=3391834 RepID=UPI0039C979DF